MEGRNLSITVSEGGMNKEMKTTRGANFETRQLYDFVKRTMKVIGTDDVDAAYMAYHLLASEIAGHPSHGLRRLPEYISRAREKKTDPNARISIEKDTGSVLMLNGNRAFGHFALRDATELAIERAKSYGISAVTVRNSDFAGRFAPFCERSAEAGVISLIFGNNNGAVQSVLPPGGLEPRLSTNPIAAGVPRKTAPHLVLDFATSSVASGRLHEEKESGKQIPGGWLSHGHLTPFGGYKGFGLSLLVEALGGALSGSQTVSGRATEESQGTLIIAMDVAHFRNLDEYTRQVDEFTAYVANTPHEPSSRPIRIPGENAPSADYVRAHPEIWVNDKTCKGLQEIALLLEVAAPQSRFAGDGEES